MLNNDQITNIFCIVDEFCQEFDKTIENHLLGNKAKRPSTMYKSEIITIMILFHIKGYKCFKHFYIRYVQEHMRDDFPKTVSYNRFVELMQSNMLPLTLFMKTCCLGNCSGISYVDSTSVRVCNNKRIYRNKSTN